MNQSLDNSQFEIDTNKHFLFGRCDVTTSLKDTYNILYMPTGWSEGINDDYIKCAINSGKKINIAFTKPPIGEDMFEHELKRAIFVENICSNSQDSSCSQMSDIVSEKNVCQFAIELHFLLYKQNASLSNPIKQCITMPHGKQIVYIYEVKYSTPIQTANKDMCAIKRALRSVLRSFHAGGSGYNLTARRIKNKIVYRLTYPNKKYIDVTWYRGKFHRV